MSHLSLGTPSDQGRSMGRKRLFSSKSVGAPSAKFLVKREQTQPAREPSVTLAPFRRTSAPSPFDHSTVSTSPSASLAGESQSLLAGSQTLASQQRNNMKLAAASSNSKSHKAEDDECSLQTEDSAVTRRRSRAPHKRPRSGKSVASSLASSTTAVSSSVNNNSKRPSLPSPYESMYNAEDQEALFSSLEKAQTESPMLQVTLAILNSGLLFCKSWLRDGYVGDKAFGQQHNMEPSTLVLCLTKDLFHNADASVLKSMTRSMRLDTMVKELVDKSKNNLSAKFPKIANPNSSLIRARVDVLKAILFLSRVHCTKKFLKRQKQFEGTASWGTNLDGKINRCLEIIEEHAKLSSPAKPVAMEGAITTPSAPTNDNPRRVSVTAESQGAIGPLDKKRRHEDDGPKQQPKDESRCLEKPKALKKRRVSLDDLNPVKQLLETGVMKELNSKTSMLHRIDDLELYFRRGLMAVQQLRAELETEGQQQLKKSESRQPSPVPSLKNAPMSVVKEDGASEDTEDEQELVDSDDEEEGQSLQGHKIRKYRRVLDDDSCSDDSTDDSTELEEKAKTTPAPSKTRLVLKIPQQKKSPAEKCPPTESTARGNKEGAAISKVSQSKPSAVPPSESQLEKRSEAKDKNEGADEALEIAITALIKKKVWPNRKFLRHSADLGKVCEFVSEKLDVPVDDRLKKSVRKCLDLLRNRVRAPMQKAVLDYMDLNDGYLPEFCDMQQLRQSSTKIELDAFQFLWDSLVPCVSSLWRENKRKMIMSAKRNNGEKGSVVTLTDEAYALLAFENYRSVFVAAWRKQQGIDFGDDAEPAKAKFSTTGPAKKGCEFFAWKSEECDKLWKELQKHVRVDREQDTNDAAEKRMLGRIQSWAGISG